MVQKIGIWTFASRKLKNFRKVEAKYLEMIQLGEAFKRKGQNYNKRALKFYKRKVAFYNHLASALVKRKISLKFAPDYRHLIDDYTAEGFDWDKDDQSFSFTSVPDAIQKTLAELEKNLQFKKLTFPFRELPKRWSWENKHPVAIEYRKLAQARTLAQVQKKVKSIETKIRQLQ